MEVHVLGGKSLYLLFEILLDSMFLLHDAKMNHLKFEKVEDFNFLTFLEGK